MVRTGTARYARQKMQGVSVGIRKNGLPFRQRYLLLKLSHHKLKHSVIKEKFGNLFEQAKKKPQTHGLRSRRRSRDGGRKLSGTVSLSSPPQSSAVQGGGLGVLRRLSVRAAILVEEFLHFAVRGLAGTAITFLDQPRQLLGVALNLGELIIGQITPGGFGLTFELLPLSLDGVFVH